ncbi:MAG TPA: hypothetical protein VE135_26335 [Pyrinomonadaceae bacterium]|nr:hypothetical protein [Pyrinomonadaceae bacterium]
MARGWESKAVADQSEEGKQPNLPPSTSPTAEQRHLKEQLESLRLSRARLLEQLEKARQPAYREVLLKGLGAIERGIEEAMSKLSASGRS